jgi:hypothetical protein
MNNLLDEAGTLLNVHQNVYDDSIRHNLVKDGLTKAFEENFPGRNFHSVPLAVERRVDNPDYVTWTATNTILGPEWIKVLDDENNNTLTLFTETRVTRVGQLFGVQSQNPIEYALIRDLNNNKDRVVVARVRTVYSYQPNRN